MAGSGVAPRALKRILGICKAYTTRVGAGPFPSELFDQNGQHLGEVGQEFGATTGRKRRCGWLDLVALRHVVAINGITELAITKLDVLDGLKTLQVVVGYDNVTIPSFDAATLSRVKARTKTLPGWQHSTKDARTLDELPANARAYIETISAWAQVPVRWVSVGAERKSIIDVGGEAQKLG